MALIEINKNPSPRDLTVFGLGVPVVFALLGWRCFHHSSQHAADVFWAIGAAFTLAFWAMPALRRTLYVGWLYATLPIAWVVSHAILLTVFYAVITPVGLLLRLFGRDAMRRRFDRNATTYWIARVPATDPNRYFRQH